MLCFAILMLGNLSLVFYSVLLGDKSESRTLACSYLLKNPFNSDHTVQKLICISAKILT